MKCDAIMDAVLCCLVCSAANGQGTSQLTSQAYFDVVSVRPVEGMRGELYKFSSSGPRVRYLGYTVPNLIMEAYTVNNYQVTFAPSVVAPSGGEYGAYDIEAKAAVDRPCTRTEFRLMLQALLADRFKLQLHRAQKEMPVYVLGLEKNGPKFKESGPDAVPLAQNGVKGRNLIITAFKQNTDDLARMIENVFFLERPVLDRTGLTGSYDFTIEATPQFRMTGDDPDLKNISIFTALHQLGLRLEPEKAWVQVLVVDHIEAPSSN
jgi:uncharacterized protein (TIGR03435 family)